MTQLLAQHAPRSYEPLVRERWTKTLVLFLISSQVGCGTMLGTTTGVVIGAATAPGKQQLGPTTTRPRNERELLERFQLDRGDPVRLGLCGGNSLEGTYVGLVAPAGADSALSLAIRLPEHQRPGKSGHPLAKEPGGEVRAVALSEVCTIERNAASYAWLMGLAVGFTVDVVTLGLFASGKLGSGRVF